MNYRKWNNILHRDLGYFFAVATIIYSLSGIALNHIREWNPNYTIQQQSIATNLPKNKKDITKPMIMRVVDQIRERDTYKSHYFPDDSTVKIFVGSGSVEVDLSTGEGTYEIVKRRPIFFEVNFLHYNNAGKYWTAFSDIFAGCLIFISISGLFVLKGKRGFTGRGWWMSLLGLIIPIAFLMLAL